MAEWRFQLGMLHTEAAIRNIRKSTKKKKMGPGQNGMEDDKHLRSDDLD